ncbi:MAG: hypothetical protein B7Y53_03500 [Halothiobacillus sp. 28-55-5]|nr:MAG: hypothetical protein B7Y53_03500 [Halothiobacillus sp. 28-55-5]
MLPGALAGIADSLYVVDVSVATGLARYYGIFHLPALHLYRDGAFHAEVQCALHADTLRQTVAQLLQHPAPLARFFHTPQNKTAVGIWLRTCRQAQNRTWQHGVFMEVAGSGVLITGHSGIGKSELALELLSRGHRLIADDAPYFIQGRQGIEGYCPENIRDLLEVRGLGIINVRDLFGANALKYRKNLRLIIELYTADHKNLSAESRLHGERGQLIICQQPIPLFRLPIAPGRNIAVFVETVVRQHNLERSGFAGSGLGEHEAEASAHPSPPNNSHPL